MKLTIPEVFQNSFILSISDKRCLYLSEIFKYYQITPFPKIYNGFSNNDLALLFHCDERRKKINANAYNCSLGHAGIIKMAKCLKLPFVFIFEDDVYPRTDILLKLDTYLSNIPDNAEILIFGWSNYIGKKQIYSNYYAYNTGKTFGSHAYIIFESAYDKYLNYYHQNPQVPADMMFNVKSLFKDSLYISNECLFIQYNFQKSNWGCLGYVYQLNEKIAQTSTPPKYFDSIDNIINIQYIENIFNSDTRLKKIKKYILKYKLDQFYKNKKCIIIGSNPSIENFEYQEYIDNYDGIVIRLNREPNKNYFKNYGSRTDLFIGCVFLQELLKNVQNKILFEHNDILDISKLYIKENNKWLTTGFITILICSVLFEQIEIFGFGFSNKSESKTQYISINGNIQKIHHDINFEHSLIDSIFKNIKRLEEK